LTSKIKIPYIHSLGTYRKSPDVFVKNDVNPFVDWKIPGLKGRLLPPEDPRPARTVFYFKFCIKVKRELIWIPVDDENKDRDSARQLITKSMGLTELLDSSKEEFDDLTATMKKMKIKYYEI